MPSLQSTLGYSKPSDRRKRLLEEEDDLNFDDRGDFSRGLAAGIDQTQALGGERLSLARICHR